MVPRGPGKIARKPNNSLTWLWDSQLDLTYFSAGGQAGEKLVAYVLARASDEERTR